MLFVVGKIGKFVGLKCGIFGMINEWFNVVEYIVVEDKFFVIFIECGIWIYEIVICNMFDLSVVLLMKKLIYFFVIVDLSYGIGIWDFVLLMVCVGVVSGVDGMIVEIYFDFVNVWLDGF